MDVLGAMAVKTYTLNPHEQAMRLNRRQTKQILLILFNPKNFADPIETKRISVSTTGLRSRDRCYPVNSVYPPVPQLTYDE